MSATVLVIEDDADTRELLSTRLERLGYEVVTAATGEAGLSVATGEQPPRAVIIDVLLPGIDGWEVARRLRADAGTRAIPVVMTSVLELVGVEHPVSADAYLEKPFRLADVRDVMDRVAPRPKEDAS